MTSTTTVTEVEAARAELIEAVVMGRDGATREALNRLDAAEAAERRLDQDYANLAVAEQVFAGHGEWDTEYCPPRGTVKGQIRAFLGEVD